MLLVVRKSLLLRRFVSSVAKAMGRHKIVPDLICDAPEEKAEVVFPSGAKAELGNELTPCKVKDIPTVRWTAANDTYYSILMTDLDAPSRKNPIYREWNHWLVGNIPGRLVAKGETLTEYIGSLPPEGTDLHRYVILVFRQNSKFTFNLPLLWNTSTDKRGGFSTRHFMEIHHLSPPVAGNFFQAKFDSYVPIKNKEFERNKCVTLKVKC